MIYYIEHTTSTNDEVRDPKYGHLDAVWAEHQSAGVSSDEDLMALRDQFKERKGTKA